MCGSFSIAFQQLHAATEFLSSHQVPINLQYGKSGLSGATIIDLARLQQMAHDPRSIDISTLRCVQGGNRDGPTYEDLLALVYMRSIATFATDPRDYVFGIAGIVDTIASKLKMSYVPFKANYSFTAAQEFWDFTVRLIHGSLELKAISLVQKADRRGLPTPNLPS
jgi:hypothetical protein